MIETVHIHQAYGQKEVLHDIHLAIPKHQITALIGANGAGKSTLISVMARLLEPSQGEVLLDGKKLTEMKTNDIAKKLSVLKQSHQIQAKLTVRELVSFGRYPYSAGRLKKDDLEKIDDALTYMKLESIQNEFIDQLSGGQKQRVYIAMILAQDTDYILLDEPLNNLDMRHAVEMMLILQRLVKDYRKTIVVVVHDINIAASFADHIVAMKDGKVLSQGDADSMIDKAILDEVYDHDFCIECINGQKVCLYRST